MTLVPSYGRDYKNKREVLEAWEGGKDFTIADIMSPNNGRQISKKEAPPGTYNIRYKNLTQVLVVKV